MATITHVSSPASGADAIYELLTLLCAAGWLVTRWSDATTYYDETGSPLTTNPYGAVSPGALGNTSAWFTVRASDSSREWLFQRNTDNATWTISRSKAGFVGGSPDATTLPTASDDTALFSAASAFSATPGRLFISADDNDDFGWRLMCIPVGGGNVRTLLLDEPLDSPGPADTDPYVWAGFYDATGLGVYASYEQLSSYFYAVGRLYKRFTGAGSNERVSFVGLHGYGLGYLAPPNNYSSGALPSNTREVPIPIPVLREGAPSTTTGWCGFTRTARWATVQGRANGQTLDGTTQYWIYAAGLWLRWDSSAPALS